jgi:choline dehydrogenase-like flavoprotein
MLGNSPAADGLFKVGIEWRCDGREIDSIRRIAEDTDRYLQDKGIAKLHVAAPLLSRNPEFLGDLSDNYHQCGGMRMSSTPSDGVVDSDCRVWGTDNVWVSGAAVFPTSSHANCTLTALALAARLATKLTQL